MEVTTKPNNTNLFPNNLPLHIYKSILLFITILNFPYNLFINILMLKMKIENLKNVNFSIRC